RAWGRRRAQGADIRQLLAVADAMDGPEREESQVIASLRLLRFYLECGRTHRATRLVPRLQAKVHALRDFSAVSADGAGRSRVESGRAEDRRSRSEEHTSELQSRENLVCRLLLEKKNRS